MNRRDFLKSTATTAVVGAGMLPFLKHLPAQAAGPGGTLVMVIPESPNSMDIHRPGTNRPSYQIAVNLYDRLLAFGTKTRPDGSLSYDYATLKPELAESWEIAADGMSATFHLRKDARFWDGTPITAQDVKWSYDRAVSIGGFPTTQMRAGSLEKTEQFEAVDDHTFLIKFLRKSKLTMPDLAVPVPIIFNSKVAKAKATEKDPWASDWLHRNPAGGGAYKLERWDPGQQTVYIRNDDWKCGPLPAVQRVIVREIPSSSTRRALLERGDVHLALDPPSKDAKEMLEAGKLQVVGTPIECCLHAVGMNLGIKPFDDIRVRKAVAYALPYKEIFDAAAYGRGLPMWGGKSMSPETIEWPQPFPYDTDLDKAKDLMAQAGLANGFETTFSFNLGLAQWSEPTALLIQEAVAKIGIKTTIEKVPGANWRTIAEVEKKLPFHLINFGGWLNYPDYYFFWVYQKGRVFNSMNYSNAEVETLTDKALHIPVDDPDYAPTIKRLMEIAFDDVPLVPLWQPYLDVVMQPGVEGYEYSFHRQLDARKITKV